MGIEKITGRIEGDAKAQADSILKRAEKQGKKIMEDAELSKKQILEDAEKKGKTDKEKIIGQKKAVADIDGRKMVLEKKQKLINDCFDEAADIIASMDRDDYIRFLVSIIRESGVKKGMLILNERDRVIVDELKEAVEKEIPEGVFKVSEEAGDFKGGLMIRQGKVYMNGTVESYVEEARNNMASEIAKVLFR